MALIAGLSPCRGQTTWSSAVSGTWSTGGDWSLGLPISTSASLITATGSSYTVTVNATAVTGTLILNSANATLSIVGATLQLNTNLGASALLAGTLQMSGNSYIQYVGSSGGHTLANAATLQSTGGTNYIYSTGGAGNGLTFANTGSVSVTSGTLNVGNGPNDSATNSSSGTMTANGGTLTFGGGAASIVNLGTLTATGGGIINFGGNLTTADLGGTINGAGGTLNITGQLNNSAATLAAPASGIFTLVSGGAITGGTVGSGALTFGSGGTLSGVTFTGNFSAASGTTFTATNGTLFQTGTTTFTSNLIRVGAGSPGLTIASDETWTGNNSIYANAINVSVVNNGTITNVSGNNYIYGANNTGYSFTNSLTGMVNATGSSLTLGDGSNDLVTNNGLIEASNGASVSVGLTSGSVVNNGTLEATGASSTLTLGSGTTTWANNPGASIIAASGGTVYLGGAFSTGNLTSGTINGTSGTLDINGSLNNAAATLNAPNGGGIFTLVSGGSITGGTVNTGALTFGNGGTLSGATFTGNFSVPSGATFTSTNGTLFQTGTTTFTSNLIRVGAGSPGLTIASDETWTGNNSIYANTINVSVVNNGTITNVSGNNYIYGANNTGYTFTNTTNAIVGATAGSLTLGDGSNDSVTNGGLIEGSNGASVSLGLTSGTVINNGILEATGASSTLTLGSGTTTWANNPGASIIAASGGTVYLGGVFSTGNLTSGTINGTSGTLDINGSLNNNAATLNAPDGGGIFTLAFGGTITGGTVNTGALTFGNGGTLSGVTLTGNFSAPSGTTFFATSGTLFQTGTTTFANNVIRVGVGGPGLTIASDETWTGNVSIYANALGAGVVNNGTITNSSGNNYIYDAGDPGFSFTNSLTGTVNATGSSLTIGDGSNDLVTNKGLIEASNGANLSVGLVSGSVVNNGTLEATGASSTLSLGSGTATWANNPGASIIAASGGTVYLGGVFSTSNLTSGTINGTGGTLDINGSLNNNAATLNAPDGGGIFTLISGGTITGGTVNTGALTFGNGGTLSGVTLAGNFSVPNGATFTVTNGTLFQTGTTTFTNDIIRVGAGSPGLTIASDEAWTGNTSIYANASGAGVVNNGAITNSSGTNYFYGAGYAGFVFSNNGLAEATGGALTIGDGGSDVFTNQAGGTVEASVGTVFVGYNLSTVTNLSGGTLTGGAWIAAGGGTLSFEGTTPINTIAAGTTIDLDGAGSVVRTRSGVGASYQNVEQTLSTNIGTLEVLNGRNFTAANPIANNGVIQLGGGTFTAPSLANGSGSTLSGFGSFNPTGGVTVGAGVLVSPGSASANNYVAALGFNSATLGQGGTYTFDVMNASGAAGTGYDTINVTGTLTVGATPSSPFTINIESINPGTGTPGAATFNMAQSYQWTLAAAGSVANFSASDFTFNLASFTNGLGGGSFSVTTGSNDIFLNFTPVPEPSTWALIAAGMALTALAAWRRRAAKPAVTG